METRIGIVGLGKVVQDIHLPACAQVPGIQVICGCDPEPARRASFQAALPEARMYSYANDMLDREHPDLVIVATPPHTHLDLCLLALESGANVLCEKPFVRTAYEADQVLFLAKRRGRSVAVNNQYRHMDLYAKPIEAVERGDFGRPYLIQCWQQMNHPPSAETNWRATLSRSTLFEFGTHPLDLFCSFFGSLPESVSAHILDEGMKADVVVQAALRFPEGRLATLVLNRVSHAPRRYLELRVDCADASLRISFGGIARASLEWSSSRRLPLLRAGLARGGEARIEAAGRSRVMVRQKSDGRAAGTARILSGMVDQAARGEWSVAPAERARELIRIVEAAYESAETGRAISLRERP